MCYSAEISLNTFIFASICAIIVLLINRNRTLSIFIVFSISLMQLLEYVAWININNNDSRYDEIRKINIYYLSIVGCFILLLQIFLINYCKLEGIERIIIISIIFIIFSFIMVYNYKNNQFDITVGKNGHLIWHWMDIKYLNIIFLFFWLYPLLRVNEFIFFAFGSLSVLYSIYNYYEYKTFGTIWCHISNVLWVFLLMDAIYKYIKL
jgi:hypothetical protein